jgi:hypothetical protein
VRGDVIAWIMEPADGLPSKADLRAQRLLVNPDAKLTTAASLPIPAPPTR